MKRAAVTCAVSGDVAAAVVAAVAVDAAAAAAAHMSLKER